MWFSDWVKPRPNAGVVGWLKFHNLTLVTHNVADFQRLTKSVVNPWGKN